MWKVEIVDTRHSAAQVRIDRKRQRSQANLASIQLVRRNHANLEVAFTNGSASGIARKEHGTHGCTHLVELLGPVATTAFQTAGSRRANELQAAHRLKIGKPAQPRDPSKPLRKPYVLDSCHAWASDGEVAKRWVPQFYTGPDAEAVREAAKGKDIELDG